MRNDEIAEAFEELASLYELDGAVVYRVVAYRNAAKAIREAGVSVAELSRQGRAEELSGVGKTIAEKIDALLGTGSIPSADKLKQRIPSGLVELTRLPGLGPKRVRALHQHLAIASLDDLRQAVEAGRLADVPGFGSRAQETLMAALADGAQPAEKPRVPLSNALAVGEEMVAALRDHPAAVRVELAGSARRLAETCKDLDVVAASDDPAALVDGFRSLSAIDEVQSASEAGARALTHSGLPVDLRVVAPGSFGSLLQHLTGSNKHNEALRTEAVKRGLHVSEYGILDDESGSDSPCADEEQVYALLGMDWIPPELRENRGELEAAREHRLPRLIELSDLRGDLHCHTVASDGRNTIVEMAEAARELGHEYLAITDHSAGHGFGNDVQPDELRRMVEEIAEINDQLDGFRLLAGTETSILPDGSPDYSDDVLALLDWVVASVHTSFRMAEREMTKRMAAAAEHPLVDAIGHPTGRLIGRREPYALDVERLIEAAVESGAFLEINSNPNRRDLPDTYARLAGESGALLVIDSDAHGVDRLGNLRFGVATARRAWLSRDQVANTRSWDELDRLRRRRR